MQNRGNRNAAMLFQGISANYKESFATLSKAQLDEIKQYSQVVQEIYSFDLWSYICDRDYYTENNPVMDWMAIYAANHSIYQSYLDAGFIPSMSLGYSMGVITAIACNGAISFEEGLEVLTGISKYKEKHTKLKENMAILIGRTDVEVTETIVHENLLDHVDVSIINNDDCITISGTDEAVEQIVRVNIEAGALKAFKLNSSIAFHSHYAKDGIQDLEAVLDGILFKDIKVPILSVYSQEPLYHGSELKQEVIRNMYSKMDWMNTLQVATNRGVNAFIDVSTDASLTKLSRLVLDEHEFITIRKLNRMLNKVNI
ncbi:ACP S-malonyltransferase [Paucisalibacillus globulus]|uniref:ACP S-malonyltransferase n=1 Tax=Paucisalibacillus globulus TaxID=351095 RepID=UPI0004141C77|nr:ACP S-malonyltransferase [Paucisalibacillus globulus]